MMAVYEKSDTDARLIWWGVFLVVVSIILTLFFAQIFMIASMPGPGFRSTNQSLMELTRFLPPEPRLGPEPWLTRQAWQAEGQERLRSYGWSDQTRGLAHMPITEAFRLLMTPQNPSSSPPTPEAK